MKKHYSVIVVGAGSIGMAAGYNLAKAGIDTLMIDTFNPPHGYGSHHGETRLMRHAAGEGSNYVGLALRAQELWYQLEEETGKNLFIPTGTLMVGDGDSTFMNATLESAEASSLTLETLTPKEISARWPGFSLPEHFTGYFEKTSGVLLNEECINEYRLLALQHKAELKTNTHVTNIQSNKSGAKVTTDDGIYYADKVIVSVGAWLGKLLASLNLPLQIMRKTTAWFEAEVVPAAFTHPHLPAFYFSVQNQRFYGFPNITGSGVKVGRNDSERETDPDIMSEDFGEYENDEGDLREFLGKYLPGSAGKLNHGKACMITKTPDKDFILDYHPEFPNVIIAGGFSGHGFKYSSVLGEILKQLVVDGKSHYNISAFSMSRGAMVQ